MANKFLIDMTGQRFGKLLVIEKAFNDDPDDTSARWLCRCDCGKEKIIRGDSLRKGRSQSCGCVRSSNKYSFPRCKYNMGVDCWDDLDGCSKCGWNPEIATQRLDTVIKTMVVSDVCQETVMAENP